MDRTLRLLARDPDASPEDLLLAAYRSGEWPRPERVTSSPGCIQEKAKRLFTVCYGLEGNERGESALWELRSSMRRMRDYLDYVNEPWVFTVATSDPPRSLFKEGPRGTGRRNPPPPSPHGQGGA